MYVETTIVGRLGGSPEMKYTSEGTPVTTFSVAVNFGYGEYKKTAWFRVTAWGKKAEVCNQYLSKGSMVLITGTPNGQTYENNNGDTVVSPYAYITDNNEARAQWGLTANEVKFLDTSGGNSVKQKEESSSDIPF